MLVHKLLPNRPDHHVEETARLACDSSFEGEVHDLALVRMFDQGLRHAMALPAADREKILMHLDAVRGSLRGRGWGVSDALNEIWYHRVD